MVVFVCGFEFFVVLMFFLGFGWGFVDFFVDGMKMIDIYDSRSWVLAFVFFVIFAFACSGVFLVVFDSVGVFGVLVVFGMILFVMVYRYR